MMVVCLPSIPKQKQDIILSDSSVKRQNKILKFFCFLRNFHSLLILWIIGAKIHLEKGSFQHDVIMVRWVGSLKMLNLWWPWWQGGGWVVRTPFFFVLFLSGSKWKKKTFSFCFKKTTTSFFTWLFFFGFAQNEKNKFSFCLALLKDEKKATATFFICLFFFLLPF